MGDIADMMVEQMIDQMTDPDFDEMYDGHGGYWWNPEADRRRTVGFNHYDATLVHKTKLARLVEIDGKKYWVPKSISTFKKRKRRLIVQSWFTMKPIEEVGIRCKPIKDQEVK